MDFEKFQLVAFYFGTMVNRTVFDDLLSTLGNIRTILSGDEQDTDKTSELGRRVFTVHENLYKDLIQASEYWFHKLELKNVDLDSSNEVKFLEAIFSKEVRVSQNKEVALKWLKVFLTSTKPILEFARQNDCFSEIAKLAEEVYSLADKAVQGYNQ